MTFIGAHISPEALLKFIARDRGTTNAELIRRALFAEFERIAAETSDGPADAMGER